MVKKFDLLVKDGYLVDAANQREGRFDIGLAEGKVVRVESEINPDQAKELFNARGKLVLPGLVDTHVHLTPMTRSVGFQMLARAGVTCALECGGFVEDVIESMAADGSGLSLVRFDALTLTEFVHKCCRTPAQMLGLPNKGHLAPGADADLVVVDPETHRAVLTITNGKIIMTDGVVIGKGGTIITTEQGKQSLTARGIPAMVADLADSLFYNAPGTSNYNPTGQAGIEY